jgi:ketosteroid isomerase-like protein
MIVPTRVPLLLAASILLFSACVSPNPSRSRDQSQAIESVLRAQETAWNRGDLDGYMREGYLSSPDLTFFSGGEVTRGYDTVFERYHQRYQEGGKEMGRLTFSDVETLLFGTDTGLVRGRWRLEFIDKQEAGGLFSLILRRTPEGWRIVHDHTSVGEKT